MVHVTGTQLSALQGKTSHPGKGHSCLHSKYLVTHGSCCIGKINIFVSHEREEFPGNNSVVSVSLNAVWSGWDSALSFSFKQKLRGQPTCFKQRILSWFNHLKKNIFPLLVVLKCREIVSECISLVPGWA